MLLRSMMLSTTRDILRAADEPSGAAGGTEGTDTVTQDQEDTGDAPEGGKAPVEGKGAPAKGAAEGDEGAGEGGPEGGEGDDEGEGTPAAQAADWRDREIKRKHRQLQESKRRQEQLERELEDARALAERAGRPAPAEGAEGAEGGERRPAAGRQPATLTEEQLEARATEIADRRVAKNTYDQQCNDAAEAGAKRYAKTWEKSVSRLEELGGFDIDTMMGVLATDDPAKVLHALGSNPDEYHRVMELPPAKRLAEMVKLAMKPEPRKKAVSDMPEPAEPVQGRGNANATGQLRDELPDDEWYRIRAAQKKAKWDREQGGGRAA